MVTQTNSCEVLWCYIKNLNDLEILCILCIIWVLCSIRCCKIYAIQYKIHTIWNEQKVKEIQIYSTVNEENSIL